MFIINGYLLIAELSDYDLQTRNQGNLLTPGSANLLINANQPNKDGLKLILRLFAFQGQTLRAFLTSQLLKDGRN
jgi:hypothetical protein